MLGTVERDFIHLILFFLSDGFCCCSNQKVCQSVPDPIFRELKASAIHFQTSSFRDS